MQRTTPKSIGGLHFWMLVFFAYTQTLCFCCNKIGMCNTYFLIWICNARKIKKILANEDKETAAAAPTTTVTTTKKNRMYESFASFVSKYNRLYCGDLFTIHSTLVFDSILITRSTRLFLFILLTYVVCVYAVWVCHHENERCHWSATGNKVSFQFFFDGSQGNAQPQHVVRWNVLLLIQLLFWA